MGSEMCIRDRIGGFGLHQSLLRFGSLLKSKEEKNSLFRYAFFKGIWATISLISITIIISFFIDFQFENTQHYVVFLSIILIPMYIFELVKIQFRLQHKNKVFATTDIVFTSILTISVLILSYFFQEEGYALALVLTPTLSVFIYYKKISSSFENYKKPIIVDKTFWSYGIFASLSNCLLYTSPSPRDS